MSEEGRLIAGRYRLVEQIGRGGMGTVWRAQDELLDRQVALKQLHMSPHLAEEEVATLFERTRREARSAARIAHPNVVVVHDVVEDSGMPCIVMEYVPSTTLGDLLKSGRTIAPDEAARIGRGMVAALRAAHAAGVLHRDVKPGNVLLGDDGRVVLTDFGIAMATGTSTLTKTGEVVGSIDYIAPERIRGRAARPGRAARDDIDAKARPGGHHHDAHGRLRSRGEVHAHAHARVRVPGGDVHAGVRAPGEPVHARIRVSRHARPHAAVHATPHAAVHATPHAAVHA
ncbi:serine/threonine-protein kinase, partial [Streptomyces sp. 2MCAF27]